MRTKKQMSFAERRRYFFRRIQKNKIAYVLLFPFLALFIIFTVIPVFMSLFYSLTYYNMLQEPVFIGLGNYTKLFFSDDIFLTALKNTIVFAVITGPMGYILSFLIAWFINELSPKVRAIFVLMFYAPSISGNTYLIWKLLFSSDSTGLINGFLMQLGFTATPIYWLQDTRYILTILILVQLWMSLGTGFLAFVAGLQGVDTSMYEAGSIDGIRNRWQELWYITLPAMRPQLVFGAVLAVTNAFAVSDISTNLAGFPSVRYAGHTIVTHLLDYGNIRFEMGYASAIATVLFILTLGCNKVINTLLKKVGN